MRKLFLLTDYKGVFGSKWNAVPYRSGMDLNYLRQEFESNGIELTIMSIAESANSCKIGKGDYVIYSSTEDDKLVYKSYIEDVVHYLELKGAKVIPSYVYLKATNNKVFMELIRKAMIDSNDGDIKTCVYGTFEEAERELVKNVFPLVIKKAKGAMSKGVHKAENSKEFKKIIKKISRIRNIKFEVKDLMRAVKHFGYIKESRYRDKFITQQLIPNLENDFKILIFYDKYFIFARPVRKNDFRASGSGCANYSFGSKCEYPAGIFDYAKKVFDMLDLPHLSLDIAYDGKRFYLIEFQGNHFGTVGVIKADVYFTFKGDRWVSCKNDFTLEKIYQECILSYINSNLI